MTQAERTPECLEQLLAGLDHLGAIEASQAPIFTAVVGLDFLSKAALATEVSKIAAPHIGRVTQVLFAAAPVISDAVSGQVSPDRIYFGLGCTVSLFMPTLDEFQHDRLLYLAWLLADLRACLCREQIVRRNDPLGRAVLARRAWDAAEAGPRTVQ